MRQEFERHRYVNQIGVVDMLLFQSHAEYQVRGVISCTRFQIEARLSNNIGIASQSEERTGSIISSMLWEGGGWAAQYLKS